MPTQEELDAQSKARAAGRPVYRAADAAEASRQAVEQNVEDLDRLAKQRAAARGGPALAPGVIASRPERAGPASASTSSYAATAPTYASTASSSYAAAAAPRDPSPPRAPVATASYDGGDYEYDDGGNNGGVASYAADVHHDQYAYGEEDDDDKPPAIQDDSHKDENVEQSPPAAVYSVDDPMAELEEAPAYYPGADLTEGVVADGIEAFVADTVVDATGVAVVMSEEEEERIERKRRKRYLCCGCLCLLVLAVAIVVPVALTVSVGGGTVVREAPPSIAPSSMPSSMPSFAPTSETFSEFLAIVQGLNATNFTAVVEGLNVTDPDALLDRNSPQYLAALWLVDEDPYWRNESLEMDDPKVIQRYALATFYFATNGDNWSRCGRNSPSCGNVEWLSDVDECDWLNVGCNEETGAVEQLSFAATGNEMMGTIPLELNLLTGMKRFLAPSNSIRGGVEGGFRKLSLLETIAVARNRLTGTMPISLLEQNPNLSMFDIRSNQFSGPIPTTVSMASNLRNMQIADNGFIGTIPSELGAISSLFHLDVGLNQLVGTIPDEIYGLNLLTTLSFRNNAGVNGTLSSSVSQLSRLINFFAGFTQMGGTLPETLFTLTQLTELNLENAQFSGTLSENFRLLNMTLTDLYLNDNQFSGPIPEAFDYLTALETLQIQGNELTGSISAVVCQERGLRFQQLATLITDCVIECNCCDNCE